MGVLVDGMMGSIESAVRTDEHIVAKGDLTGVHEVAVVIGEKVVTDLNIEAKAAEHHRLHIAVLTHLAKELADDLISSHHVRGTGIVVLPA